MIKMFKVQLVVITTMITNIMNLFLSLSILMPLFQLPMLNFYLEFPEFSLNPKIGEDIGLKKQNKTMLAVMQSLTCNLVLKQTINQQLKAFLRAPSAAAEISVLCSILPSFLPLWVF